MGGEREKEGGTDGAARKRVFGDGRRSQLECRGLFWLPLFSTVSALQQTSTSLNQQGWSGTLEKWLECEKIWNYGCLLWTEEGS